MPTGAEGKGRRAGYRHPPPVVLVRKDETDTGNGPKRHAVGPLPTTYLARNSRCRYGQRREVAYKPVLGPSKPKIHCVAIAAQKERSCRTCLPSDLYRNTGGLGALSFRQVLPGQLSIVNRRYLLRLLQSLLGPFRCSANGESQVLDLRCATRGKRGGCSSPRERLSA
jgi:hypothetical protein